MRDHVSSAVTSETKNTATPRDYWQGGWELDEVCETFHFLPGHL